MNIKSKHNHISVHLFYNAPDLSPVILKCVAPLVETLKKQALISSFFFIRYWDGGQHVRLRVRPIDYSLEPQIRQVIDHQYNAFLDKEPSLFDPDPEESQKIMRALYEVTFGKTALDRDFGPDRPIPLYPNNSFQYFPYEPEYGRYGGEKGIDLAHAHFEVSSEIAFRALGENNSHIKKSMLALAFKLMIHFVYSFYEDEILVAVFFRYYGDLFNILINSGEDEKSFRNYSTRQSHTLRRYINGIAEKHKNFYKREGSEIGLYLNQAYELRPRLESLYAEGHLIFEKSATNLEDAIYKVLASYVHMMNNRLGITMLEEVYLSRIIHTILEATS